MTLAMVPLEIIGLKTELQAVLHTLQHLGCLHIDDLTGAEGTTARSLTVDVGTVRMQEEVKALSAQVEGLLDTLPPPETAVSEAQSDFRPEECLVQVRAGVEELAPQIQSLISRRDALLAEQEALPRYEATLRKLLPITPSSAREPGNVTVGILLSQTHADVLDVISRRAIELTGGRADVTSAKVDPSTHAMLLVFPQEFTGEIESLLGHKDVSRIRLPAGLAQDNPEVAFDSLNRRRAAIEPELAVIERELIGLSNRWHGELATWRDALRDELESIEVLSYLAETEMTFVLMGWTPAQEVGRIRAALEEIAGERVLVRELPMSPELDDRVPILLENPKVARPFESLVCLLARPRYGKLDPTQLMAFFMPMFFGMMLGDIGYGALLLAISLIALRRFKTGFMRDIVTVLAMGAGWTIIFGILFGELFGTLGEHLGLHALWFDRASPEHMQAFLLMAVAVGGVHLTLGLLLGVWEAFKERHRNHLLERGGMLLGLLALFLLAGALTGFMPEGFMTPAIAGLIVGIVLLGASVGWIGILLGPVEFIGLIGNLLSYLRIAAIGLTSIYLAQVANDVAGKLGNLIVGALVAVLIHALNLVMGAFSPTIHSLRLHYVEFFRKFYEGGGRPYQPFKSRL
jgi:V/A-type H+-transporting ATPase subunit I